jgi:hypothetical protein
LGKRENTKRAGVLARPYYLTEGFRWLAQESPLFLLSPSGGAIGAIISPLLLGQGVPGVGNFQGKLDLLVLRYVAVIEEFQGIYGFGYGCFRVVLEFCPLVEVVGLSY